MYSVRFDVVELLFVAGVSICSDSRLFLRFVFSIHSEPTQFAIASRPLSINENPERLFLSPALLIGAAEAFLRSFAAFAIWISARIEVRRIEQVRGGT